MEITTSKLRKIIFTIIGLLTSISISLVFGFFLHYGAPINNAVAMSFSFLILLFLAGIIFIVLGYIRTIYLWYVFLILLAFPASIVGLKFSRIGRFPPILPFFIQYGIILLIVIFATYLLGIFKQPLTIKKEIIFIVILLMALVSICYLGFVNAKVATGTFGI